jgi:hypothetical protein
MFFLVFDVVIFVVLTFSPFEDLDVDVAEKTFFNYFAATNSPKVITPETKLRKLKAFAPPKTPDMFWQVRTFLVFFIIRAAANNFNLLLQLFKSKYN